VWRSSSIIPRLGAVEHAEEDRLAALNDDPEDRGGDEQANDRIGERVAEPHADRTEQHRQARPAIDARMVPVRDQRRAVDLLTDANPEKCHRFIAYKADNGGGDHGAYVRYLLGMQQPLDALISRHDRARENREHDRDPGQVLDAAIAEREALARRFARKPERDRERDRGRGVTEIMDGVRE